MRRLRAMLIRLAGLFRKDRRDHDLTAEMEGHLQMHIEDNLRAGMSAAEARRQALMKLGGVEQTKENYRERRGIPFLETVFQDLRYGTRMLQRNPGFTAVAVATLALAIGANTAIFSLLDGLALRNLAVPQPEQLVRFGAQSGDEQFAGLSLPMYEGLERDQQVFSSMFAWWGDAVLNVETNGTLSRGDVWAVTGNFYSELGATPELGRLIEREDVDLNAPVATPVAVLGYGFWQRHYGGDGSVVGKILKIEGQPFTIIGVARTGFTGITADLPPEVTIPLTAEPLLGGDPDVQKHLRRADVLSLEAAGRLKPGLKLDEARAQLELIWPAIRAAIMPTNQTPAERANFLGLHLKIESGSRGGSYLRKQFTKPLYVLLAISGLVLLIACVNLASLMLARASARSQEMGLRVALGASRSRLARQVLTESVSLSVTGTLVGLLFANWCSQALASFIIARIYIVPAQLNLAPDAHVLGFTAAAAILTGVLIGLAPAWRAVGEDPNAALKGTPRTLGPSTGRLGKGLIVTQVALSLTLLASAGLFIRSLEKLHAVQPGFRTRGVLDVSLFPKPGGYKKLDWANYYRQLTERVAGLPGVESVGISHNSPGRMTWTESVRLTRAGAAGLKANFVMVMPEFFRTMGINLARGRTFTWRDDDHAMRAAIVSESLARNLFPNSEAIGQNIDITTEPKWQSLEIVGIASDVSFYDVHEHAPPTVYVPSMQYGDFMGWSQLLVQTKIEPGMMGNAVRQAIESLGHEYVMDVRTIVEDINRSLLRERIIAILSAFFGGLALLLAAIGLYGLMAYNVNRRAREIGVRIALGATRSNVLSMILRETIALTLIGLAVGLPCTLAASRLIRGMLFGVSSTDAVTLVGVSLLFIAVAAVAGWLPARRAMRVDPMVALRYE